MRYARKIAPRRPGTGPKTQLHAPDGSRVVHSTKAPGTGSQGPGIDTSRYPGAIPIVFPIMTPSCANLREHWAVRARRMRAQRTSTRMMLDTYLPLGAPDTRAVHIVRIAPRHLDSDNLAAALKAIRDGVADWLGIDDGDPRVSWSYSQEKGAPAVRIECYRDSAVATCQDQISNETVKHVK